MMTRLTITCVCLLGTACSSHPGPIIDQRGVNTAQYQRDLAECESYADSVSVAEGAARGAATGAVVGAAAGAISGDASEGAGYGGIAGATRSGLRNQYDKEAIVKRCLRGRGYRVLN